jgi:hypothetical protein
MSFGSLPSLTNSFGLVNSGFQPNLQHAANVGAPILAAKATAQNANTSTLNANTGLYNAETSRLGMLSQNASDRARLELDAAKQRVSPYAEAILNSGDKQMAGVDDRYQQSIQEMWGLSQQQAADYLKNMEGMGDAARQRIYRDATAGRNSVGSELATTGLYNTSVLGTLQMQVDRNRNEALGQLDEGLRRERAEYLNQITAQALDRRQAMSQQHMGALSDYAGQRLSSDVAMRGQLGTDAKFSEEAGRLLTPNIDDAMVQKYMGTKQLMKLPSQLDYMSTAIPTIEFSGNPYVAGGGYQVRPTTI